jgi:putative redox protein
MPSELSVHAVHHGGMRVTATARDFALEMDYPLAPSERGTGLRPLEVLLASLAGCSVNTLALLLQRVDQPVRGIEAAVRGVRRDGHPTVFTEISLDFVVRGQGVESEAVERALLAAEQHMCPVWAMLQGGPRITASFRIEAE